MKDSFIRNGDDVAEQKGTKLSILKGAGYTKVNGAFDLSEDGAIDVLADGSVAVKDGLEFLRGTFFATVTSHGDSGLAFGLAGDGKTTFSEEGVSYFFFYVSRCGLPTLAKVEKGVWSNVKQSTLSAMYWEGATYCLKVVLDGDDVCCYVDDNLHVKCKVQLFGGKAALRGDIGAKFADVKFDASTELLKAKTLIFGHSYVELWHTYKQDFAEYDDVLNIGIGGTQSPDWAKLVDEVAAYGFDKAVYMIGINDFGAWNGDVTAAKVFANVAATVDGLHELLPRAIFALVNVNKVPLAEKIAYYGMIDEINEMYADFAAKRAYVKLVDFAGAALNDDGSFKNLFVSDGLHLNEQGYEVLTALVKQAFEKK